MFIKHGKKRKKKKKNDTHTHTHTYITCGGEEDRDSMLLLLLGRLQGVVLHAEDEGGGNAFF